MRLFLIAGEASGDKLGAALMVGLKALHPEIEFLGVGGPLMEAEGLQSQFPMTELSVMGIAEIAPKYFHLKRRIRETAEAAIAARPDAVVSIDSPDFSLRVAKLIKLSSSIRTVHYVAPTVWAWRPERAEKMAKVIDQVLALFPFEPPFMEAAGMRCDFVGHPVVAEPKVTVEEVAAFRTQYQLEDDTPLILALPGSRKGEVSRLSDVFGQALSEVKQKHPKARVVLPMAHGVAGIVPDLVRHWPIEPILLNPTGMDVIEFAMLKRAAFAAADVALAASGTVSLELAATQTPMVIAYDMNWITRQIVKRKLLIDTVTLVNIVSETRVVPEFLGENCQPAPIAQSLIETLADPSQQQDAMNVTMQRLGQNGAAPGIRAAQAVLDGIYDTKSD
ncbi:lipid-A-disaccharide synthase [Cochlodiniinecator piscidefendens]|uniref:lipid-A-disaccharide synthase n=1 Tax=Cochlodiniinecator piscidefendens TaxID=2715756 RepID=UPI00140DA3CB|nr:lipid-A-disaccharide synthase [Cochlodiniinecator piscidefendens]